MYAPQGQKILNTKGTHCRFGIAGNLGVVLAWLTECEHAATHKWGGHHMSTATVFILTPAQSIFSTKTSQKSTFSLQQLPQKVDFLYTNIPQKSHFSGKIKKKIAPQNPGSPPPGGGGLGRRADPPTLADPAIPKPEVGSALGRGGVRSALGRGGG